MICREKNQINFLSLLGNFHKFTCIWNLFPFLWFVISGENYLITWQSQYKRVCSAIKLILHWIQHYPIMMMMIIIIVIFIILFSIFTCLLTCERIESLKCENVDKRTKKVFLFSQSLNFLITEKGAFWC